MKCLICLIMSMFIISCGKSDPYTPINHPKPNDKEISEKGISYEGNNQLIAMKSYTPVLYQDDKIELDQAYYAKVPPTIDVVSGNAGNHEAELKFDSNLVCLYKGESSMTNPLYTGDMVAISGGRHYKFKHCTYANGNKSAHSVGSLLNVQDTIKLFVKNGDSQAMTKAQVNINLSK